MRISRLIISASIAVALCTAPAAASFASAPVQTGASAAQASAAKVPTAKTPSTLKEYKNCTALNKKYPHGVGKRGAKDKVSGGGKGVTNFTVNTKVYNQNKKSDRDKDGVACEKK